MAAVFQRVASAVGQSVTIDIGAAGNDRLLICQYGDESIATDDVAMGGTPSVDGKDFTLRIAKTNDDGIGNAQEMWTIDEAALGSSNGSLSVSGGGVDGSSAIRVELWYGIDSGVPEDTGFDDTTIAPTDSSITMDCPADGIVVLGYGNGNSFNTSGWTSPLTERVDAATNPPASAGLGYASGIETSAQTGKTYTATGTVTLRSTMIGMSFAEASTGQGINVGQSTETNVANAIVIAGILALAVVAATESDIAQAITVLTEQTISLGQATEVDIAIPIKQPPVSIARWLLDEASSGQSPTTTADDTGNGNDLDSIQYGGTDLNWTSIGAGNGLEFTVDGHSAIAELDDIVNNGNIGSEFANATAFSFIIRADFLSGLGLGGRVFFIGADNGNGDIGLITDDTLGVQVRMDDDATGNEANYAETYPTGLHTWGVTVDSTESVQADRVKLYKDGILQSVTSTDFAQNVQLTEINQATHNVSIGNRGDLLRGAEADVYYVELFTGCLSESEHLRAHNALVINNDRNWIIQTVLIGQATETNIAQSITVLPETPISVSQATETDLSQAIAVDVGQLISVDQAIETDLSQPITVVPGVATISVGQAVETDLSQSITIAGQITVGVGQATEVDLSQSITVVSAITIGIGQAIETDIAQTITFVVISPFEIVLSAFVPTGGIDTTDRLTGGNPHDGGRLTDDQNPSNAVDLDNNRSGEWAFVLQGTGIEIPNEDYSFRVIISPSTELDNYAVEAIWTISSGVVSVGQAFEVDLAQAISVVPGVVTIAVGQSIETDIAQPITVISAINIVLGQAVETDLSQSISVQTAIAVSIGQSFETDLSQPISIQGAISIGLGQSIEIDLAQVITPITAISISIGQALESDLSQTIAVQSVISILLGQVTETDISQSITIVAGEIFVSVGQAIELDEANKILTAGDQLITLGQALEIDIALDITPFTIKPEAVWSNSVGTWDDSTITWGEQICIVNRVWERDIALMITVKSAITISLGQTTEIDVSQSIEPILTFQPIAVSQALETNFAQIVDIFPSIRIPLGQALETDIAQVVPIFTQIDILLGQTIETDISQIITPANIISIGVNQALEIDISQSVGIFTQISILLGQANEVDISQSVNIFTQVSIPLGQSFETDFAQIIIGLIAQDVSVNQVIETDFAQPIIAKFDFQGIGQTSSYQWTGFNGSLSIGFVLESTNSNYTWQGEIGILDVKDFRWIEICPDDSVWAEEGATSDSWSETSKDDTVWELPIAASDVWSEEVKDDTVWEEESSDDIDIKRCA